MSFTEIRIADLGVIDHAVLELGPGLSVITGETGAGKTMLLTGLGLILGEKADPQTVRSGAERAFVEGRLNRSEERRVGKERRSRWNRRHRRKKRQTQRGNSV